METYVIAKYDQEPDHPVTWLTGEEDYPYFTSIFDVCNHFNTPILALEYYTNVKKNIGLPAGSSLRIERVTVDDLSRLYPLD